MKEGARGAGCMGVWVYESTWGTGLRLCRCNVVSRIASSVGKCSSGNDL
jgi:hypothetical protein